MGKLPTFVKKVVHNGLAQGQEVLSDVPMSENARNDKFERVKKGLESSAWRCEKLQDGEGDSWENSATEENRDETIDSAYSIFWKNHEPPDNVRDLADKDKQ